MATRTAIVLDDRGTITEWNLRAEAMFGWNAPEVVNLPFSDLLRGCPREELVRLLATGDAVQLVAQHKNAVAFAVEILGTTIQVEQTLCFCVFIGQLEATRHSAQIIEPGNDDDRPTTERSLEAGELPYKQIVDNSPDCIKVLDLDGRLLSMNAGGCRALEIDDLSTCLFAWWPELWPEAAREPIIHALELAAQGNETSFIGTCPTAKGTPKWWDVRLSAIRNAGGEPERILVISRDITVERRTEREAQEARERLHLALEGAQIGTWTWDFSTDVVVEDERCFANFGLPREGRLPSMPQFIDAVHPADRERVKESLSQALKTGHYRVEFGVVWPDGSIHFLQSSGEVTFEDSKPAKMYGVTWDVTARSRAEESLRTSEAKLKEAQEVAHVGHFELDLTTHALVWSDELYRIYGLPPEDGITFERFQPQIPEDDRAAMFIVFQESVATGKPRFAIHRVINTDGSVHYVESRFRVEQDSQGRSIKVLGTNLDVTAREEASRLLRKSHEELERRVEERTKLLAQSNGALLVEIEQHKLTQNLVAGQNQVLRRIAEGLPIREVLHSLVEFGERESDGKLTGAILLKSEDGRYLQWTVAPNIPEAIKKAIPEIEIGPGNGVAGSAAFDGARVISKETGPGTAWLGAELFQQLLGARSMAATPIFGKHNQVLGTVSFCMREESPTEYELRLQDACASLAAVALLRDEEQRMRRRWEEMFQHASWGMALADVHTEKLLAVNPAYAQMLGYPEQELTGRSVFDLFGQRVMPRRLRQSDCFALESHISYRSIWKRKNGLTFPVSIDVVQIRDSDGEPLYWGANVQDISEQRAARTKMNDALRQYRFLADLMPQIVWTARSDGWTDYVNQKWTSYMGMSLEQAQQSNWETIMHADDVPHCSKSWARSVQTGEPYEIEYRLKRASDGEYRWHLARALPFRNETKEIVKWFGTCTDVHEQRTDKQRLEAEVQTRTVQLRRSLTEKETLLKEVHHRVKNNLQIISSLLRMQGESLQDAGAVAALQESRQRVLSMALIHERLYGKEQMDEIDFAEYTRTLVNELFYSYGSRLGTVVSRVEASCVLLNIDQAIPCGLILNELVTNALKYAYPRGASGEVLIELKEPRPGCVRLSVSDQGVGLPDGFNSNKLKSLGLPIVHILAKQIGGTFSVHGESGARFVLDFPRDDSKAVKSPPAA